MKARGVHRRNQAGFFHRRDVTGREIVSAGYSKHPPHLRRASRTVCENRQHVPCDPAAAAIQDARYHVGQRVLHFSPAASFHGLKPFGGDGKPVPPVAADCLLRLGILLQLLDRQAYGRLMKDLRPCRSNPCSVAYAILLFPLHTRNDRFKHRLVNEKTPLFGISPGRGAMDAMRGQRGRDC